MHAQYADIAQDQQVLVECIESGTLSIYYQPILTTDDATIRGVEALVRIHETDGELATNNYLQIAHSTGLIETIDRWVVEEAIAQVAQWNREHKQRLTLFSNMSELVMAAPELPEFIEHCLKTSELEASLLNIEISEGAFYNPACVSNSKALRDLGVKITIDNVGQRDRGTIMFPTDCFDFYKLDKKLFINNSDKSKIERYLKQLREYDAEVVAVGIEQKYDLDVCLELGIKLFQGFYAAHPLPPEDFKSWFISSSH
ncbi:MAG: EAL domain-containing protein [Alteromonadaceae bacterium]|nr:EAL domain-containing protein [Alteromonadaceae bacterium]